MAACAVGSYRPTASECAVPTMLTVAIISIGFATRFSTLWPRKIPFLLSGATELSVWLRRRLGKRQNSVFHGQPMAVFKSRQNKRLLSPPLHMALLYATGRMLPTKCVSMLTIVRHTPWSSMRG